MFAHSNATGFSKAGKPPFFPNLRIPTGLIHDHKIGFWRAVRLAGIIPPIRFHDLRHTFVTRLVRERADLVTVQGLLVHATI